MHKTTVYLPDELKTAVGREALRRGVAEAQVIRDAIARAVVRPAPRSGLFTSSEHMASRVDQLLDGFGEQ